jgi:putative membrane protein
MTDRPGPDQNPRPSGRDNEHPDASGIEEPDVRFSYANERTFLAWIRTALALIATGVAAAELLPKLAEPYGRRILGLPFIVLGGYVAIAAYRQWQANEQAMRTGQPPPRSKMPTVLAAGIAVMAVVAIVLGAIGSS